MSFPVIMVLHRPPRGVPSDYKSPGCCNHGAREMRSPGEGLWDLED